MQTAGHTAAPRETARRRARIAAALLAATATLSLQLALWDLAHPYVWLFFWPAALLVGLGGLFAVFPERVRPTSARGAHAKERPAEAMAQAPEAAFRGMVSHAADAVISIDEAARIVLYNDGAAEVFGWTREEAVGKPLELLLPERFRAAHARHVRDFAADTIPRRDAEGRAAIVGLRKDGSEFPAEASIAKQQVDGRQICTVILRDITERVRVARADRLCAEASATLAASLEYDEVVATTARLAVSLGDYSAIARLEEDGALRCLAVTSAEPQDAELAEAVAEVLIDSERPCLSRAIVESKQPLCTPDAATKELQLTSPREVTRPVPALTSVMGVPLIARGRLLGALMVATSRSQRPYEPHELHLLGLLGAHVALAISNAWTCRQLQLAVQARDDVLGFVAHDLLGPLNNIVLQASQLRRAGAEVERRSRRPAEAIERAAVRMHRIIQDLLDATRLEAGHLMLARARVSARRILYEAVENQRHAALASALDIRLDTTSVLPEVCADADRLLRIFENLLGNAIKFTPHGGHITLGAAPRDDDVLFWVSDTGVGVSAEDLSHLFERFWQARRGDSRGAGLGLSIAKGLAEAHGGRMWAESTTGAGSTFYFTIPVATEACEPAEELTRAPQARETR